MISITSISSFFLSSAIYFLPCFAVTNCDRISHMNIVPTSAICPICHYCSILLPQLIIFLSILDFLLPHWTILLTSVKWSIPHFSSFCHNTLYTYRLSSHWHCSASQFLPLSCRSHTQQQNHYKLPSIWRYVSAVRLIYDFCNTPIPPEVLHSLFPTPQFFLMQIHILKSALQNVLIKIRFRGIKKDHSLSIYLENERSFTFLSFYWMMKILLCL